MRLPQGVRIALLLSPALVVILVLFAGGLVFGLMQSLDYFPVIGLKHFDFNAYRRAFHDKAFQSSIVLTFRVAVLSTSISAVLAVAAALLLRSLRRGRRAMTFIFQLNLPIPHIVGAVSILFLLSQAGVASRVTHAVGLTGTPASFPVVVNDPFGVGIIAEYVWKEVPFIGIVVLAALASGIEEFEDVARTLGAGRWQRFRHVILPLITPAVVSTSIIVLAFTFGAYEVPFLLGQPYPAMLPVLAYQNYTDVDLHSQPEAMAIAMIIAAIVGVLAFVYMQVASRYLRRT